MSKQCHGYFPSALICSLVFLTARPEVSRPQMTTCPSWSHIWQRKPSNGGEANSQTGVTMVGVVVGLYQCFPFAQELQLSEVCGSEHLHPCLQRDTWVGIAVFWDSGLLKPRAPSH